MEPQRILTNVRKLFSSERYNRILYIWAKMLRFVYSDLLATSIESLKKKKKKPVSSTLFVEQSVLG